MGKFRKRPIVIEAFQMTEARRLDNSEWPDWLHRAWQMAHTKPGSVSGADFPDGHGSDRLVIRTLEGQLMVSWDDWIIQGVQGELYPCKPDIFEKTYEAVDG